MLTIACRDVGQPCDCVLSGEMEEEHLKSAAEHAVNAQNKTMLGESFFVEKGKITSQKGIDPNRTQFNFSSNGTMNGKLR
jgi:predicted small metal-binding protein